MSENSAPRALLLERLESRCLLAAGFLSFTQPVHHHRGDHPSESRSADRAESDRAGDVKADRHAELRQESQRDRHHNGRSPIDQPRADQGRPQHAPHHRSDILLAHSAPPSVPSSVEQYAYEPPVSSLIPGTGQSAPPPFAATNDAPTLVVREASFYVAPPTQVDISITFQSRDGGPTESRPAAQSSNESSVNRGTTLIAENEAASPSEPSRTAESIAPTDVPSASDSVNDLVDRQRSQNGAINVDANKAESTSDTVASEDSDARAVDQEEFRAGLVDSVGDIGRVSPRGIESSTTLMPASEQQSEALTQIRSTQRDRPSEEPWELNRATLRHLHELAVESREASRDRVDRAMAGWFHGPGGMIAFQSDGGDLPMPDPASYVLEIPLDATLGSHRWLEVATADQTLHDDAAIRDAVLAAIAGEQAEQAVPMEERLPRRRGVLIYSGLALAASTLAIASRRKSKNLMSTKASL